MHDIVDAKLYIDDVKALLPSIRDARALAEIAMSSDDAELFRVACPPGYKTSEHVQTDLLRKAISFDDGGATYLFAARRLNPWNCPTKVRGEICRRRDLDLVRVILEKQRPMAHRDEGEKRCDRAHEDEDPVEVHGAHSWFRAKMASDFFESAAVARWRECADLVEPSLRVNYFHVYSASKAGWVDMATRLLAQACDDGREPVVSEPHKWLAGVPSDEAVDFVCKACEDAGVPVRLADVNKAIYYAAFDGDSELVRRCARLLLRRAKADAPAVRAGLFRLGINDQGVNMEDPRVFGEIIHAIACSDLLRRSGFDHGAAHLLDKIKDLKYGPGGLRPQLRESASHSSSLACVRAMVEAFGMTSLDVSPDVWRRVQGDFDRRDFAKLHVLSQDEAAEVVDKVRGEVTQADVLAVVQAVAESDRRFPSHVAALSLALPLLAEDADLEPALRALGPCADPEVLAPLFNFVGEPELKRRWQRVFPVKVAELRLRGKCN